MYITEYNLIKNETRDSALDETDIDYILLNEVKYDKQLLMKSEQDAQIDATIHYLEDIKDTEEYKNAFKYSASCFNIVSELAILGKEYDKVLDYNKMIKDLNIYYRLERYYILYILYLIYNERIKYTKEDIIVTYVYQFIMGEGGDDTNVEPDIPYTGIEGDSYLLEYSLMGTSALGLILLAILKKKFN